MCPYKERRQTDRESITWRHRCTERRRSCDEVQRREQRLLKGRFQGREILSGDASTRGDYSSASPGLKKLRTVITFKRMATGNEREFVQAQTEGFLKNPALRIQLNWILYSSSTDLQTAVMENQMNGLTRRLTRVEKHVVYEWSWEKAKGRLVNPHSYYY